MSKRRIKILILAPVEVDVVVSDENGGVGEWDVVRVIDVHPCALSPSDVSERVENDEWEKIDRLAEAAREHSDD